MYKLSVQQWSPFKGCKFGCPYCKKSFQAQAKRQRKRCPQCYTFEPHEHEKSLGQALKRTGFMQFIFTCSLGDISFCPTDYLNKIVDRIRHEPTKTFLLQTKNPATFNRVKFPANVILGITLETNRDDLCRGVSKAPPPSKRVADFIQVQHHQKSITIEPVMDFDLDAMVTMIEQINPVVVWLGYDSKRSGLPEPSLEKVHQLQWELFQRGYAVLPKTIREAR